VQQSAAKWGHAAFLFGSDPVVATETRRFDTSSTWQEPSGPSLSGRHQAPDAPLRAAAGDIPTGEVHWSGSRLLCQTLPSAFKRDTSNNRLYQSRGNPLNESFAPRGFVLQKAVRTILGTFGDGSGGFGAANERPAGILRSGDGHRRHSSFGSLLRAVFLPRTSLSVSPQASDLWN
jgi:hypothetical protein